MLKYPVVQFVVHLHSVVVQGEEVQLREAYALTAVEKIKTKTKIKTKRARIVVLKLKKFFVPIVFSMPSTACLLELKMRFDLPNSGRIRGKLPMTCSSCRRSRRSN